MSLWRFSRTRFEDFFLDGDRILWRTFCVLNPHPSYLSRMGHFFLMLWRFLSIMATESSYHIFCVPNPHFSNQNKSVLIYLPLCVSSGKLGAGSHKVCIQPIESVLFYFFEISEFRMFKQCIFLILLFNFRCPTWKTRRWSPPLNLPAHPINKSAL